MQKYSTVNDEPVPSTTDTLVPVHSVEKSVAFAECENKLPLYKDFKKKRCLSLLFFVFGLLVVSIPVFYGYTSVKDLFQERIDQKSQNLSPEASHFKKFVKELQGNKNFSKEHLEKLVALPPLLPTNEHKLSSEFSGINRKEEPLVSPVTSTQCDMVNVNMRFDCLPDGHANPQACESRGCCWQELKLSEIPERKPIQGKFRPSHIKRSQANSTEVKLNVPFCFYPSSYSLYNATIHEGYAHRGINATLKQHSKSGYPKDIPVLSLEVRFETCSRVRIRITDPHHQRWETPLPAIPETVPGCHGAPLYDVNVLATGEIVVSRSTNAEPLFDTRNAAPLIFSDQYLQLSTILSSPYIYGLGQHLDGLLLDTYWKKRVLWNVDAIPNADSNLYGSHPFYMVMEPSGTAHGVFLLNSNAMDVILQPLPALTFRAIGGVLDFYVFLGPTPDQVISQYTEVVGRTFLPPYWSLGYHQCRFGYNSLDSMKKVWKRTKDAGIPFDVQWNDIDYMTNQNDFTYDNVSYAGLPQFVDELHELGMHYVIITDPGISAGENPGEYQPFDLGVQDDVFVKNSSGDLFIGKVWNPTATVFPDFTRPNAVIYWSSLISQFRQQLPFDGLWIDMNEPSNFWDGQKHGCPKNSSLEHPPYQPSVLGGVLYHKTLCMTARHYIGSHYDVHNLYGISEAASTFAALKMTKGIPHPFIISRASFPGLGAFAGHWTGDVKSDWFNLWKSIGDVLTTNLLGIPMVGADICGFNDNTTASLCNRWMQLGAFYPFSRNHNTDDGIDQDPVALGELVVRSSRKALLQRYTLLPFLHTLFVKAHKTGIPVARPLFFKYPEDTETYALDTQFLWGNDLMIAPVLEENATSVEVYFPEGRWYDWYSGKSYSTDGKESLVISAPLDTIPLMVAGGSILPCQNPGNTTTDSRKNPFGLVVALDEDRMAAGQMAWNRPEDPDFMVWEFRAMPHRLTTTASFLESSSTEQLVLGWIKVFGVSSRISLVTLNGDKVNYTYSAVSQVMYIPDLSLNFKERINVLYY